MNSEPSGLHNIPTLKWIELGPLNLETLLKEGKMKLGEGKVSRVVKGNRVWQGQVKNGIKRYTNQNLNSIYEGEFKDGRYHGYGRKIFSKGWYYEGQWLNGKSTSQAFIN